MNRNSESRYGGFTLVELLVVIGIIAVLIGILLPVLGRARKSANTIKCAANLRAVGQGIILYTTQYRGTLPPSNFYKGLGFDPATGQIPTQPTSGYVHWSSFLYQRKDLAGTDAAFKDRTGWDAFTCPSLPDGGLPPANTFAGNNEGLTNEAGTGVLDWQAPRLAYTVNEALCPRGIFQKFFSDRGNLRIYKWVPIGRVRKPGGTILATEIWGSQQLVQTDSLLDSSVKVSASRRPVNGFTGGSVNAEQLYKLPTRGVFTPATVSDMDPNPSKNSTAGASPTTLLDWVGRNHGPNKTDGKGWDTRKTNFLYVDGHVETKHVRETVSPFEWGERFYTLE
jgi:prepilin-type N-terminal cleavage/methylation domain-containing protein/prepilin-type processing-associated H-X9-DG protein